ncbi:hypothetical protein GGR92_002820 [Spirosoma lacussanchae]|uniref:hypothetical protein n=1 Tax=Spirosoma lacussanchae TaxID=1884249 RepID=UPI0011092124|nr:hypothetical protein [Spirosoma lacussanchae]
MNVGYWQGTTPQTDRHKPALRPATATATVLICESRSAYAYHSHECHGLARCRSTISRVSTGSARSLGYKPCRICY